MRAVDFRRRENIAARNAKAAALRKAEADAAAQRKAADKDAAALRKAADDAAAAQVKAADNAAAAELFLSDAAFLIEAWKKYSEVHPQDEEVSGPITCLFFCFCALCNPTHKKHCNTIYSQRPHPTPPPHCRCATAGATSFVTRSRSPFKTFSSA